MQRELETMKLTKYLFLILLRTPKRQRSNDIFWWNQNALISCPLLWTTRLPHALRTLRAREEVLPWTVFQTVLHALLFYSHNPEAVAMGTFLEYLKINYS